MIKPSSIWATTSVALLAACAAPLSPGEPGTARYFGEVEGEVPLRLLPPQTDRDGNIYVLYGDSEWADTTVFVGHAWGGWSGGCSAHRGNQPVHGFTGHTEDRSWYWSGDALVEVNGENGACQEVLAADPVTGAEIRFRAVIPWVRETVSRSTLVALVQSVTDPLPFHAVVDVDQRLYGDLREFEPSNASELVVLGTGANERLGRGYLAVQYSQEGTAVSEILVLDSDGFTLFRIPMDAGEILDEFALEGGLRVTSSGKGGGVLTDGRVLLFNENGSLLLSPDDMNAVGVQIWEDTLWVVGESGGAPRISQVSSSLDLSPSQGWTSSSSLATSLAGGLVVLDERSDPSRNSRWSEVKSAVGPAPLLSAHPLDVHTLESTGWLFAGPFFESTQVQTAVAFAPVGVSFP